MAFKNEFQGETKVESKNKLLKHLNTQKMMGIAVSYGRLVTFKSHVYCLPAFCHISGISVYLAVKVLKDFQIGITNYIHGNKAVPRESIAHVNFLSWMICFSDLHGQSDPVKVTTVLPAFLNKAELFKIYEAEAPKPHLKCSTFYFLMKKKFGVNRSDKSLPNIRISKYSTHSKCDICAGIDKLKSTSKSQPELDFSRALKYKHRERVSRSRIAINNRKQLAFTFPSDNLFVAIDGMDNSKSYIPRFNVKTKKLGSWKLPSKITGAVISSGKFVGGRKVKLYVNHDHFTQGSNMVVSIVYKIILDFMNQFKMLPKVLDLNLDNCWRENKVSCQKLSKFFIILIICENI